MEKSGTTEERFTAFCKFLKDNQTHDVWCSSQTKGSSPNTIKSTEPCFDMEKKVGSAYNNWITQQTNYTDFVQLYALGDPIVPESNGGLKWEQIRDHIYNSGEFTLPGKRNNYSSKLHKEVFFPSGKTDGGRRVSQFLNRLWFLVNKC